MKRNPYTKQMDIIGFLNENFNVHKLVKTNDDWYPNWDKDSVYVALRIHWYKGYYTHFYAKGEDDYMINMIFDGTYEECVKKYYEWIELYNSMPEIVSKKWFFEHGFKVG